MQQWDEKYARVIHFSLRVCQILGFPVHEKFWHFEIWLKMEQKQFLKTFLTNQISWKNVGLQHWPMDFLNRNMLLGTGVKLTLLHWWNKNINLKQLEFPGCSAPYLSCPVDFPKDRSSKLLDQLAARTPPVIQGKFIVSSSLLQEFLGSMDWLFPKKRLFCWKISDLLYPALYFLLHLSN